MPTRRQKRAALLTFGTLAGVLAVPLASKADVSSPVPLNTDLSADPPITITADTTTTAHVSNVQTTLVTSVSPAVTVPGSRVTFTSTVKNTGAMDLQNVQFEYDSCDPVVGPTGDTGTLGILSVGETWTYKCTTTVTKDLTTKATVSAQPLYNPTATPTPTPTTSPTTAPAGLKDGTFTGATTTVSVPGVGSYTIAVQAIISGGKITTVNVPVLTPSDSTSRTIAQGAIPTLNAETITAQSASIANVSGATYTSKGYKSSLADALTQAAA